MRRVFILTCLLALAAPAAVWACTCSKAPPGMCPGFENDDVVFLGTVVDIASTSPADSGAGSLAANPNAAPVTRTHFRVDERFAGPYVPEIDVFSGGDDGDCGYRFQKGEQYIVFTQQEAGTRLFATICNGTRPASEGRALVPQLRAMRNGDQVASVFGVLRRTDPPFLAPSDDPDDPLPRIKLKLRSKYDRFSTSTGPDGTYSFYDVHAGEYQFTAGLPARMEFSQRTLKGALPPFKIPNGACYEYNVDALPTGTIRGSVLGPDGKPLPLASLELYRADRYSDSLPGLWGFQGREGFFKFDHVGPGEYILVFNRLNRIDPNSPFPRSFYPGVPDLNEAKPIVLKDSQQLLKTNIKLKEGYPTRQLRVHLKWEGGRHAGEVTIVAKADKGENPAARLVGHGVYEFSLLASAQYTISAWEDLEPGHILRSPQGKGSEVDCTIPSRIDATRVTVSGEDTDEKEVTLVFPSPACQQQ
jgi:hypothetical protein